MKNLALLSVLLWTLVTAQWTQAKIISMAVGQARDHVLTSREVQINQALEQLLYPEKKSTSIKIITDTDSPSFAKQVTSALLEWVVYIEANSMNVEPATAAELNAAELKVKTVLSKLAAWKNLKATPKEVQGALARKIQAKKFIRFRADSSVVPISESEAQRYFEQNRLKFGDLPYENFRTNIKGFLARQQVERRLKDWFEVLQAKYQVRNFLAEL